MLGHLPFVGSTHSRLLASQLRNVLECTRISVGCEAWVQWALVAGAGLDPPGIPGVVQQRPDWEMKKPMGHAEHVTAGLLRSRGQPGAEKR